MSNLNITQFNNGNEYTAPNGRVYTMKRHGSSMVTAHTPSGRKAAAMVFLSTAHGEPEEDTIGNIHVSGPHRRKGVGTAMLDYARATGSPNLHHSDVLSADGAGYASATPRPWQPKLPLTPDNGGEHRPSPWKSYVDFGPKNERSRQEWAYEAEERRKAMNAVPQGEQLRMDV